MKTDSSGAALSNNSAQPVDQEEWVPEDDAIIGRAFRWSLVVFIAIGAAVGLTVWQIRRQPPPAATKENVFVAPQRVVKASEAPRVIFTDITQTAGIDFIRENGAAGDKLLPETMGGGAAFFDYDGDGDQDILLVNGTQWPWADSADKPATTSGLYRNDGTGHFENVTTGSGLDAAMMGMGVAVGDYDNDGDPDVFVTCVGGNRLFRNDGGRFIDITSTAGVGGPADGWSVAAGFFDSDNDGDLDLWVSHYVKWNREIDFAVDYRLTGIGRAYGVPMNFEGAHSYLYANNGDGTFVDRSEAGGLQITNRATGVPVGKALGLCFVDLDHDGLMDVIVANDTVQNFVFRNLGGNRFQEIGAETGLAFDAMGNSTGAMGIDAADVRCDNKLAVGIGNFANEMTSFYVAGEDPLAFTDMAVAEGVGGPTRAALSFGLFFFDYDLDGRLDLLQCNGHLEEEINKVQPSQHYEQPAQLFWNAGPEAKACFSEIPGDSMGDLARPIVGRGAVYADIDGDGDLDVLLTQARGRPLLVRNDQALGHHWLRVKLIGERSNRDAVGAVIELEAGGFVQRRQIGPTRSYASQVELPATFGLGGTRRIDRLTVQWPGGDRETFGTGLTGDEIAVDQLIVIRQGHGVTQSKGKLAASHLEGKSGWGRASSAVADR
ncbi:MAG: CRTAC1 family protein [Phycisphaerae bacterium]|nr:CRTAC1 family protein [Phycisphaerae bacterium]